MEEKNYYTRKEFLAALDRAKLAQRIIAYEECCKLICPACLAGEPVVRWGITQNLCHTTEDGFYYTCKAAPIKECLTEQPS